MPSFGSHSALEDIFQIKKMDKLTSEYLKILENARKKWIVRELERDIGKQLDTYSITTNIN